jgi:pyrroline-5-carboxylate reductase
MSDAKNMQSMNELAHTMIVLLGCGRMGGALAGGMVDSGRVAGDRLVCLNSTPSKARRLAEELGARTELATHDGPRIWIVAVKPKDVPGALADYADQFGDRDTIVSVAAGLRISKLRALIGPEPGLVRAMPNTPALVRRGVTGIMADGALEIAPVRALFESVGHVVELGREEEFDALTGVSGSGPAYIFTAIEALADGGVMMGLSREVARQLAVHTVAGAAALVEADPALHTAELKDRVASPGGTTIKALAALEERGFRNALIRAVEAAATHSRRMGEEK